MKLLIQKLPYLGIALFVFGLFYHDLVGLSDLSIAGDDNLQVQFPFLSYFVDSLRQYGRIDPWTPFIWGGAPAVGNPNVPLNLETYLLAFLSKPALVVALNWHLFFESLAAAIGFYALLQNRGFEKASSFLGAILYVTSTSAAVLMGSFGLFFPFVVFPWVCLILFTQKRRGVFANVSLLGAI